MVARADVVVQVLLHFTRHTSHVTRHTSQHSSHVTSHMSFSLADYVIRSPYLEGVRNSNVLQVTRQQQFMTRDV